MSDNKLDTILIKLNELTEQINIVNKRLDTIENKTNDIHYFVPFVGWLEDQGKKIVNMSYIPSISYFKRDEQKTIDK
jgi:hypothetical protein